MQSIGVLGGLGPQATMDFEARLHAVSQQIIPRHMNRGYPPLLVRYHRDSPFLLAHDERPFMPLQPDPQLFQAAQELGQFADFLVIPSNAPHLLREDLERAAGCRS